MIAKKLGLQGEEVSRNQTSARKGWKNGSRRVSLRVVRVELLS